MSQKCYPNLVISGVVKGGTTSLFSYLSQHSDVCASSIKETCYFSKYRYGEIDARYSKAQNPFTQYLSYFEHCRSESIIMEATPGYFEGGRRLASQIKSELGDSVKIVIILRDPVDRLVSFYKFKKAMLELPESLSFSDYIDRCRSIPDSEKGKRKNNVYWGIEGGLYANYIDDWFDVFGDSVRILFFDHLKTDPHSLLSDLCEWLGISTQEISRLDLTVENKTVPYRNKYLQKVALRLNKKAEVFWRKRPDLKKKLRSLYYLMNGRQPAYDISEELINELREYFYPHNQLLTQKLIAQNYSKLPGWLLSDQ